MKRILLTSIAMVALSSSAALAQASATSVSSGGPTGANASISSPSSTSSSAEVINTAGTIVDIDLANASTPPLTPGMVADGFDRGPPERLIGALQECGNEFGNDASAFCNFSIEGFRNSCASLED